jgi:hypothetical protein
MEYKSSICASDFEKEERAMAIEFALESRRNKKALLNLTKGKSSDFNPFLEEDRVTPYRDIDDLNGSFNGTW